MSNKGTHQAELATFYIDDQDLHDARVRRLIDAWNQALADEQLTIDEIGALSHDAHLSAILSIAQHIQDDPNLSKDQVAEYQCSFLLAAANTWAEAIEALQVGVHAGKAL